VQSTVKFRLMDIQNFLLALPALICKHDLQSIYGDDSLHSQNAKQYFTANHWVGSLGV